MSPPRPVGARAPSSLGIPHPSLLRPIRSCCHYSFLFIMGFCTVPFSLRLHLLPLAGPVTRPPPRTCAPFAFRLHTSCIHCSSTYPTRYTPRYTHAARARRKLLITIFMHAMLLRTWRELCHMSFPRLAYVRSQRKGPLVHTGRNALAHWRLDTPLLATAPVTCLLMSGSRLR